MGLLRVGEEVVGREGRRVDKILEVDRMDRLDRKEECRHNEELGERRWGRWCKMDSRKVEVETAF